MSSEKFLFDIVHFAKKLEFFCNRICFVGFYICQASRESIVLQRGKVKNTHSLHTQTV